MENGLPILITVAVIVGIAAIGSLIFLILISRKRTRMNPSYRKEQRSNKPDLVFNLAKMRIEEYIPEMTENTKQNTAIADKPKFPGTLWLLPIFLGILGGIIAALIADMKYKAEWGGLFLLGVIASILSLAFLYGR